MKKIKEIGILFIFTMIILSFLSSNVTSTTTIGDSSVYIEEGDKFTWKLTYVHPLLQMFIDEGGTSELTIEKIYEGSYGGIDHALIVNITEVEDAWDTIETTNYPTYIVYNKSLNFIKLVHNVFPYGHIIPIPINLTLIAKYHESLGENCSIDGNKLFTNSSESGHWEYTYNSNGFATTIEWKSDGMLAARYKLLGGKSNTDISFGNYFILFSIVSIISMGFFIHRKITCHKWRI